MEAESENAELKLKKAFDSFEFFNRNVFPLSWNDPQEPFVHGKHLDEWARLFQEKPMTLLIAPRKHSKSRTLYSYLLWQHWRNIKSDFEIAYFSYSERLAAIHIREYKEYFQRNPLFKDWNDLLHGSSEGIAKWAYNGRIHRIYPMGILTFKRGIHPDLVILDDILLDPTEIIELKVIKKINQVVKEQILQMPKRWMNIKAIGTAQTKMDFFYDENLQKDPDVAFGDYKAIVDVKNQVSLWPEKYPWELLVRIRQAMGEKAFSKEMMVNPVYAEDSYFKEQEIMDVVNPNLRNVGEIITKNTVGAGWDLGKKAHPAHFTVFEFVPIGAGLDIAVQRYQIWMDGWDYHKQLELIKALISALRIDYVNYDNTRGEMEKSYEEGELDNTVFFPQNLNHKYQHRIATEFQRRVTFVNGNGVKSPLIQLINNSRMINQILTVTEGLESQETHEGHSDSFWSISLALDCKKGMNIPFGLG